MRASEEAEEMGMDLYEMAETVDEFVGTTSGYYNSGNVEYFSGSNSTNENDPENSKKVRIHHHLIINKMDRDEAEKLWGNGWANSKRLQPNDFELTGVGKYIANQSKDRWSASRNLKKPKVSESRTGFTKRRAMKLLKNPDAFKEIFEKDNPECIYKDFNAFYSDDCPGIYIYVRLRKKE